MQPSRETYPVVPQTLLTAVYASPIHSVLSLIACNTEDTIYGTGAGS